MEQQLLTKCEQHLNEAATAVPVQALSLARSLITNPSTSESTISSLFETLTRSLHPHRDPSSLHRTLSLLSDLAALRPHLSHPIFHSVRSFSLLRDHSCIHTVTASLSVLLSIAESDEALISSLGEFSEGLFLAQCFLPSVADRCWLLSNAERFRIRPHVLVTVLLGFMKDPFPNVRRAALDGLVGLSKSVVVEDRDLVESCYCRAVELLTDMEDCVRSAAVRVVTQWGQLLVALTKDSNKRDWSDALFLQLCSMVRDMSVKVRVEVFDALGEIGMVSEDILLQTLSKKLLSALKDKNYPGLYSGKPFELRASDASGVFLHGLEDEFCEVRRSACHSLQTLSILSANFAGEGLNLLMDVLNDDSMVVRLQALETMHCMALFDRLKVQETHMHMFISTLVDMNATVRSAARKVLRITKLNDIFMFKLSVDGLLENLEMYPQDEADVFCVLSNIGRNHGNFALNIIEGVSEEIEPSCDKKLGFDSGRVAALLVLAISAPLSHQKRKCSIPPRLFSYAVTLLERISPALSDVMDQDTLLAYLSRCSRSTVVSAAEFDLHNVKSLQPVENDLPYNASGKMFSPAEMQLQEVVRCQKMGGTRKVETALVDYQVAKSVNLILEKVKDIWQLIQLGCMGDVLKTLRSWKEELSTFTSGSLVDSVAFVLQYLRIVKLLAKIWLKFISPRKLRCYGTGHLGLLLVKLDRNLREMRYKFIGLSKQEELHVLELVLLSYILSLSSVEAYCDGLTAEKLHSTLSQVEFLHKEGSIEPSNFVTQLKKSLHEIGFSTDGSFYSPLLFQKLVEIFSLDHFIFSVKLKHIKAELDVHDNDFENPFHFVPGLPVGIPLDINLYNISRDNRLWLRLAVNEALTEFIFLDFDRFGGNNQICKSLFVAPFYKTPKAKSFTMKVYLGMECSFEDLHLSKSFGGPKRELVYLCKEKEVFLKFLSLGEKE
ncbi:LOW QUALITY PROTEIN: protein SIEL [Actinidia eriantha]|uniref:LOW QUALITY PROTEIN: protein SIEL n=1 Tax=Actinidia eriantha TaxID=165200 RepID=UPI002588F7E2|nr:LOW QUALITY PROTEIN: protein SIEL [Actinidia eriantha]